MKTASPYPLAPGDFIPNVASFDGQCRVVRSIDWVKRSVTLEVLSDSWAFNYVDASFEEFYDAGLDVDREYCSEVLSRMLEYADPRNNLGSIKVPKATFKRLQQQKAAI